MMTLADLKLLIKEVDKLIKEKGFKDKDIPVYIPVNDDFDGRFYSPCFEDSGLCFTSLDPDLQEEDIEEAELLNKEIPGEFPFFAIVPCGFHEEKDRSFEWN